MIGLLLAVAHADPNRFSTAPSGGGGVDPSASAPTSPPIGAPIPADVLAVALAVRNRPLPERMGAVSAALLGRPYVSDPMGEGVAPDADPFARYDAFDCLTFAEEVLALSMAGDPVHAAEVRAGLRYGDEARDYVHRRHFMELQWIPGVIRDGWMRDTTASYGAVVTLDKEVTAATWPSWSPRKSFGHTDAQLPVGPMRLDVLTLDEAARVADRVRPGSLVLTVRVDRAGVPIWVTHVSLLVPGADGLPVIRHATKIGDGGTRDHGFRWYLDHVRTYSNWKVLGIAILEPIEQGPRLVATPRSEAGAVDARH